MSLESITPLPASSPSKPDKPAPLPDLSALRQGWGEHQQAATSLPSLPVSTPDLSPANKPIAKSEKIPALPGLGSIMEKESFTLDDLDHLLANIYPEQAQKSPTMQSAAKSDSLTSLPAVPSATTSTPRARQPQAIPLMEFPTPVEMPRSRTAQPTSALDAMPSPSAPKVSLPLARDQFVFPTEVAAKETVKPTPTPPVVTRAKEPSVTPKARPQPKPRETALPEAAPKRTTTPSSAPSAVPTAAERPDYTDADLHDALRPIIDQSVDKFLYTPTHGIHTYLEPMLRSTVRRAIAEQMDDVSPFQEAAGWDKFAWKMRALFSSRTYEEVLFDHTKRYQVEEVFLLRYHTRSLISYASNNPARHATTSKVQGTVKKVASKCSSKDNAESDSSIKWEDNRNLMIRRGKHCILAAIVNGNSNAVLRSDLDYALRQAEERFGKSLEEENDIHLQILQPLLEGCLLIKAPAIPN